MLLLLIGVSSKAQSISANQMDERFNDNKLPYGWFTQGWKVDSTGVVKKGGSDGFDISELLGSLGNNQPEEKTEGDPENPEETTENDSTKNQTPSIDLSKLMGGGEDSYNYLMTPPLSVKSGEVLTFSAKKGEGGGSGIGSFMGGDNDTTFVVERAIYGEHRWKKVADFTTQLDSVFKTFTISNTEAGEYRFRFRAGGNVEIDSVAGFHIDTEAPDIYPAYLDKNIQPVDLGLCDKDTVVTFNVINTGTGTLDVSLSLNGEPSFSIDQSQVSVAAADTAKVKLTHTLDQAHEGRNSTMLSFKSGGNVEEIILPIDAVKTQAGVYVQDFNTSEMPIGWFADGWEMKENTASVSKSPEDMGPIVKSNESFFLMTPPLKVKNEKDVLLFSVKLPGGDGGGFDMSSMMGGDDDEGSKLAIEKSVYGSNKWEKIKDFTHVLDTVYTTQWISNLEPGDYRFRFVATDSLVIDSVAGFQFIDNAPDMYVKVDDAVIRDFDFGLLTADSVKTYTVINTGTGKFSVNALPSDPRYISLDKYSVSLDAGQSDSVNVTVRDNEAEQGEVLAAVIFQPADQKIAMQMSGIHAYIIPKDSWQESFEPEYVVEDKTYPCRFPEGWTSTGWEIVQSGGDMMSMFMGGDSGDKPYVASSSSNEYELITPRLQAKQGQVLKFNAQAGGGMAMMMSMFGADMGAPQYLSVYYKRNNDQDWTLYNMYFTSGDAFFKAPYSGYYQLKFVGGGSSVDEFLGFSLPKDSIVINDSDEGDPLDTSWLNELDGQTRNVVNTRKLSARNNGDGTFQPVAATVCLPYEFNIDEYYEPGIAKLYQMAYVDTVYNQFIFKEMPDNLMEAGTPYMIMVNRGEIQFNTIDSKLTSKVADGIPVYDFTEWYWYDRNSEVGTWNGTLEAVWSGNNDYFLRDVGIWELLGFRSQSIHPFRAFLRASESVTEYWYRQNPDTSTAEVAEVPGAGSFSTRFYEPGDNGRGDVEEKSDLIYIGDLIGGADGATGIVPTIRTIDRDGTENFFDLQGRRLNSKPNKGIYIENGKKYAK